jgi:hypothetical protein
MAAKGRVVSEDCILDDGLTRPDRLEELPQMRPQVVVIISVIVQGFKSWLLARHRVVDHKEIPGITGGALNSDEALPGPIYLQGSEAGRVAFRNIVITPALQYDSSKIAASLPVVC